MVKVANDPGPTASGWDALRLKKADRGVRQLEDGMFVGTGDEALHDRKGAKINLDFGSLSLLDTGLEGLIGLPQGQPEAVMRAEHINFPDSDMEFKSGKGMISTSRHEWNCVVELASAPEGFEHPIPGVEGATRRFLPLKELERLVAQKNAELEARGFPHMQATLWEAVAARLYTGSMYFKYNNTLRACSAGANASAKEAAALCLGNTYVCTIHAANSAIVKLSKLTRVCKIYRGISGGNVPRSFFEPNSAGLRGGVELGFLSITDMAEIAYEYASRGEIGSVFEVTMTMSARGASISFLSQYPHEQELIFPPLTGYDVHDARIEGKLLILECSLVIPLWLTLQQALDRTPRFLDRFELQPGAPLHISRTAAVLAAAETVGDGKRPVALKFMCMPAQVEAEIAGRCGLEPEAKAVVSVLELISDDADDPFECSGLEHVACETRLELAATLRREVHNRRPIGEGGEAADVADYRYCLVLDLADCNLSHALTHERFAGDWPLVRKIGLDLIKALAHLHDKGRIHADLKPLNIVRVGARWQLIDLDVSCPLNERFGDKVPSSGYCPPEMARVLRDATRRTGEIELTMLSAYDKSSVAYDLWSLGCVLYHLCFGKTLHHTNHDDNVTPNELRSVGAWGEAAINRAMYRLEAGALDTKEAKAAVDLIKKLLTPSADGRLAHFKPGVEMASVAEHPFFLGQSLEHDLLVRIELQVQQSYALQVEMDSKLDQMLDMLNAQFKMLGSLLHGIDKLAPKLIVFLPVDAAPGGGDSGVGGSGSKARRLPTWLKHPRDWLKQRVRVFFVDPVRLSLAPTNDGNGFEIDFPKPWVAKAMPYVKLALTALKVASAAGRLAGVPIPNVAGLLESQLGALNELKCEAIGALSGMTSDAQLAAELLDGVDQKCMAMLAASAGEVMPHGEESLGAQLDAPLQRSVKELDSLLPVGWKEQTGLSMVTAKDGTTEWVLPQDSREFSEKGKELLGARSEAVAAPDGSSEHTAASKQVAADEQADDQTLPLLGGSDSGGNGGRRDPAIAQLFEQVQLLRDEMKQAKQNALCPAACEVM